MEARFSPGQKIIRIGPSNKWFIKDNTYTVAFCEECENCHRWNVFIEELPAFFGDHFSHKICNNCGYKEPVSGREKYHSGWSTNFAPIQDQYSDITAEIAAGVTETKEQPDKVIIPAKPETAPCENTFS